MKRGVLGIIVRAVLLGLAVLLTATPASAMSLSAIRSNGERLAAEARKGRGQADAERRMVDRLGELVLAYIDESDRIQASGQVERRRVELRRAFDAVHSPLDAIYRDRSRELENLSRAIMDEDGDLEALYETAAFQAAQAIAANALYYLNWLNYYGSRVSDGDQRERLLRACESGFSQFTVGEHESELVLESQLGRGLCSLERGNREWAERDFRAVIESNASADRKAKARLALLDSRWRARDYRRVVSSSQELLASDEVLAGEKDLVRFYQLQALLELEAGASEREAVALRQQVSAVASRLRRAGTGWRAKVDGLLLSQIDDPADWTGEADTPEARWQLAQLFLKKEDCAGAAPLLDAILAESESVPAARRAEVSYWVGVCRFRAKQYLEARAAFELALAGEDPRPWAPDARYFRFKTMEALMATQDPTADTAAKYVASIRAFLSGDADPAKRDEAAYRLGEYLQATGDFSGAIEAYSAVSGDAEYQLRARFGTLQSRFELLRAESDPAPRAAIDAAIAADFAEFDRQAAALAKTDPEVALNGLAAKVDLLRAVWKSLPPDADLAATAGLLRGFAERYPDEPQLVAQASRIRLRALLELADYEEAAREVEANRAILVEEGRVDAVTGLARAFAKKGRMSESFDAGAAASQVALELYAIGEAAGGEAPNPRQQIERAQLRESGGDLDAAQADYERVLAINPKSLPALRGLARIAEQRDDLPRSLRYWVGYTEAVKPGDVGWFRGQYEQARLAAAMGKIDDTCKRLRALRTAMPALQDEEIQRRLRALFSESGC